MFFLVKRDYDYIRFGRRSDPLLKEIPILPEFIQQQQKKQDDKKASGNSYDYIRFGKRSL